MNDVSVDSVSIATVVADLLFALLRRPCGYRPWLHPAHGPLEDSTSAISGASRRQCRLGQVAAC